MTRRRKEKRQIKELEDRLEYVEAAKLAHNLGSWRRAIENYCMAGEINTAKSLLKTDKMTWAKVHRKINNIVQKQLAENRDIKTAIMQKLEDELDYSAAARMAEHLEEWGRAIQNYCMINDKSRARWLLRNHRGLNLDESYDEAARICQEQADTHRTIKERLLDESRERYILYPGEMAEELGQYKRAARLYCAASGYERDWGGFNDLRPRARKMLIEKAKDVATSVGCSNILLGVGEQETAANDFYNNAGFADMKCRLMTLPLLESENISERELT